MSGLAVGTVAPTPLPSGVTARVRAAQLLVIGGSVVAPVELFVVRSLTVYDILILTGFVLLAGQGQLRVPPPAYVVAATAFLLAAAVSTFRATYPTEAVTQLVQYAFIMFGQVPVLLAVVRTRRAVVTCLLLLAVGALLAALHAYVEQETQGAGRAVVFFSDNPNRLGYPAAFLLPLLLFFAFQLRRHAPSLRGATRVVAWAGWLLGLALTLWSLGASASRSALVGTLVALAVALVLVPGAGGRRVAVRAAALAVGMSGVWLLLSSAASLPATLAERVQRSFQHEERSALVADRENLASAGLRAFADSPLVGTGLDNFRYVATDYDLSATPQAPHNLWVQLLAQVGLVGTLAFAALLLWWFARMLRAHGLSTSPVDQRLVWTLVAAMSGTLAILMATPEMLDRHYWLMFGLGLAAADGVNRRYASFWKDRP